VEDIDFINIWIQLKFFMARVIHLPSTFCKIEAMCAIKVAASIAPICFSLVLPPSQKYENARRDAFKNGRTGLKKF
jgi:hypothetical protein